MFFTFLLVYLTAYRLTRLVTSDSILDAPRERLFRRFPPTAAYASMRRMTLPNGMIYWKHEAAPWRSTSKFGELFNCPWCIGFWIAGATVLVVANLTSIPLPVLWWFAASSAIGLTARSLDA